MNRLFAILSLVCAAHGQAPLPTPASFAWEPQAQPDYIDYLVLQWPTGSAMLWPDETNYTVAEFPAGISNPVSLYAVGTNGQTSASNTIYVLNVRAVFDEADAPTGPWLDGPEASVLVERPNPRGFIRVRLEIQ